MSVCACAHSQVAMRGSTERARDEGGGLNEREGCNGQGGGEGDAHAWEEEKGIEREEDLTGV